MVRKFLSNFFGMKDYIEGELQKGCFTKPKYVKCCSGEEHKETLKKKKDLENKTTSIYLGRLKLKEKKSDGNV